MRFTAGAGRCGRFAPALCALYQSAASGSTLATNAQRLLAEYLFAFTRYERLEASTDVTNIGEQKALVRAGFTREGVLRHSQWRAGAFHDNVLFSRLRGD